MASEFIQTHILGLDEKMEGGIPKGYIILISGPPGSYKSSLAFYMAYKNMLFKEKGNVLYFSLNQSKMSLLFQMEEMNMKLGELSESVRFEIVNNDFLRELRSRNLGGFVELLKDYRKKWGSIDFLVIDTLNLLYAFTIMSSENPVIEIIELFETLRDIGATTFLISETPFGSSRISQYEIEPYLSDGIFHLSMERIGRTLGRYISVIKLRGRKHSTDYYPLLADDTGFRILAH